jgi:hypothetical protein
MKTLLRATTVRPDNATLVYSFNLNKNGRVFWALNGAGLILFILFGMFFSWYGALFHPELTFSLGITPENGISVLLLMIGVIVGQMVLHELVHGAFFWFFTQSRPKFGFRIWYAYAAAPGWFLPRGQYLVVTLAPFVLLSVLGMLLLAIVSQAATLITILFATVINATSAVGDLWIAFLIIRERRPIVVEDMGEGMDFYLLA